MKFRHLIFGLLLIVIVGIAAAKFLGRSAEDAASSTSGTPESTASNDPTPPSDQNAAREPKAEAPKPAAAGRPLTDAEKSTTVQTKDLSPGSTKMVVNGSQLKFNIIVKLKDGTVVFDSYKDGRPWTGTIGDGSLITGIDLGLRGMYQGGKRALWIPPHLAYGENGIKPQVPPNSNLYAEVELVSVY